MFPEASIERHGHLRGDALNTLTGPQSRALLWHDGRFLMADNRPLLFRLDRLPLTQERLLGPVYLGNTAHGNVFAFAVDGAEPEYEDAALVGLREAALSAEPELFELLFFAQGLLNWHARHPFCSRCGNRTRMAQAGHMRVCLNSVCARKYYPKLDPAVIFSIVNTMGAEPRILLARKPEWDQARRSVIAGFVEPGEQLEDAVRREAWEETGLNVTRVHYLGSQPWPFPDALMIGFTCETTDEPITLIDAELESAAWYSVAQIKAGLTDGSLRMPYRRSIAWNIIDRWFQAQCDQSLDTFDR